LKLVWVRWLDAGARHGKWINGESLDCRFELQSAGLLVCEHKDFITLACDFDGDRYRDVATIPKSLIIEKQIITITPKKK
jgi:hypothetical protein